MKSGMITNRKTTQDTKNDIRGITPFNFIYICSTVYINRFNNFT